MQDSEGCRRAQGMMVFLASVSNGLEDVLGRGAGGITFRAGKTTGLKQKVEATDTANLDHALELVWNEMCRIGMRWAFEPYKLTAEPALVATSDGRVQMKLVFRNCLVRSALFRYGHPQKLSLCLMNHGLFCGLLEKIHGGKANLEILHAGENACLKLLTVEK